MYLTFERYNRLGFIREARYDGLPFAVAIREP